LEERDRENAFLKMTRDQVKALEEGKMRKVCGFIILNLLALLISVV
jgi:hypothetical protein